MTIKSILNRKELAGKISVALLCFAMIFFLGCTQAERFKKDCDLCKQINQKEVEATLINFVYNDVTANISAEAEIQLTEKKEILHHGHKFMECGCIDDRLMYHLWCANDATYQLEVKLLENNLFLIVGLEDAEFLHP